MQRAASFAILSLSLLGCGDDDPAAEPKPNCSIGVTLTGDVQATFSARDETACGINVSLDSGIDVAFIPLRAISGIELRIGDVTEGETGGPFPTGVGVTTEEDPTTQQVRRYGTSSVGCNVEIGEHRFEETQMSVLGEERHYQVVGTGSCSESAVPADMMGEIAVSNFVFRATAIWTD